MYNRLVNASVALILCLLLLVGLIVMMGLVKLFTVLFPYLLAAAVLVWAYRFFNRKRA